MTQSYISPLRPYMPIFKTLTKLKLKILIGLVIGSLIIITIGVYIRVYTRDLIKGLIGRKYSYNFYYRATYFKQKLYPPYNQASIIFIILQLITISKFKQALIYPPPYCGLILIKRQELVNHILLLFFFMLYNIIKANNKLLLLI